MSWFKSVFGGKKEEASPAAAQDDQQQVNASEADEVLAEDNRSLITQLISKNGLTMNMDLSKIALPTFILEPRSLLEKLIDVVVHPEFFCALADSDDPEVRMTQVVRWYFSAFHVRPRGTKKPYNPVLGETFRGVYTAAAATAAGGSPPSVQWVSQQVSHHPPVSAFFARSAAGDIVLQGSFAPKSRFLGNSAASLGGGAFEVFLARHNEVYYATWPNVYVRGVLFGTLLMELGGDVEITCPSTGYTATIKFETKGFFGGSYHKVKGSIAKSLPTPPGSSPSTKNQIIVATIDGNWTTRVDILDALGSGASPTIVASFDKPASPPGTLAVVEPFDIAANEALPPILRMYSSQSVWADLTDAIRASDQQRATDAKNRVEEYQRELRAERKARDPPVEFQPSLFRQVDPTDVIVWEYTGPGAIAVPSR